MASTNRKFGRLIEAREIMNAVEAGTREPPTMAEFKAGLPQIAWSDTEP